ncbi:MAG TPA: hypothetical protein VIM36_12590 [Gemmatimonadaceae bacterium]
MRYRVAFPVLALVVAGGCGGSDATAPASQRSALVATGASSAVTGQDDNDAGSVPRSGALHVTKECYEYTRLAGGFCTITSSNLPEIPVGTKVVYQLASGATVLNTDVILDPPGESSSTAFGHVVLDLVGKHGHIDISGGTGRFKRLSASADISWLGGRDWAWDGTYSFSGNAAGGE